MRFEEITFERLPMDKASEYGSKFQDLVITYGLKIIGALIAVWIGFKVVNYLIKLFDLVLSKKKIDPTIRNFLDNLIKNILKALVLVMGATMVGVETTSFIAVFAALGLAIGMALSGTLGNFASGVMILIFKPFKSGHLIETAGQFGTVKEVQIFNTILKTLDAKTIIIPNSIAIGGAITNYSLEKKKRVDIDVGISYDDNIDTARKVLQKIADKNDKIIHKDGVTIAVKELGDSAVILTFRTWVKTADYWDVNFGLTESIKKEFDKANLNFPFPQREIHNAK